MNKQQKTIIETLRKENYPYRLIAEKLDLNINTVKSYCKRHGIVPINKSRKKKTEKTVLSICTFCGKPISNDWNRAHKRFCSDKCRTSYWNEQKGRAGQTKVPEKKPAKAPKRTGLLAPPELS